MSATGVTDCLAARGMSEPAAEGKAELFGRIESTIGGRPGLRLYVPGRIEFLGKHTDYAGGRSLVGAIERGICFAARPRSDGRIVAHDALLGLTGAFDFDAAIEPHHGAWAAYPMVAARRIARNFPGVLTGADIHFASDLSPAAGMSTSSALITGCFQLLAALNHLPDHPSYQANLGSRESLAEYLGAVENGSSCRGLAGDGGVGTFGGSQDHAAILLSEPGKLLQVGFHPVRREAEIPFPADLALVIGVSGVVADKTGTANAPYNRIARATQRILGHWNRATGRTDPTLMAAVTSRPQGHQDLREILEAADDSEFDHATLLARLEQVVMESTVLIPDAADALRRQDLPALGATVDISQTLAERMLGNQVPETVALARRARELGARAASAFGAGFGGSVYAVMPRGEAGTFMARWADDYRDRSPTRRESSRFFQTRLGPPLTWIP
jgi:galactokinase